MIQSFDFMNEKIVASGRRRIAVAVAQNEDVLLSIDKASALGIAEPILIGHRDKIIEAGNRCGVRAEQYEIIEETDDVEACNLAVRDTHGICRRHYEGARRHRLRAQSDPESRNGIRDGELLSHIGLFFIPKINRPMIVTDAGMCIAPDVAAKKHIIENAVKVAHLLGIDEPQVACICALEKVNSAMQATVDAEELVRMNREGDLTGCRVGGPFALDNALFPDAARRKGVTDPVAGNVDILLMPNIEAGNVLYKALAFLCDAPGAGLVLGAKAPVIVTSRSDLMDAKLNSITLALYIALEQERRKAGTERLSRQER